MVLCLLALAAVVQAYHYYPLMPETMGSHFDGAGRPDGCQSKEGFFVFQIVLVVGTVLIFGGMRPLFRRLPPRWINMPHREYWLAPERRGETLDLLARQMEWFGVATLLLYLVVLQLVYQANQMPEPRLDSTVMWWALGAYFLYAVVFTVRMVTHFRKPEASAA